MSLVFARLPVAHPVAVLAAALLPSAVFSLAGFINAIFARNFDQVNWIPAFILTPLTYFGGVFYSVTMLPGWAQKVSLVNPILYMVNAFRYGFLGISDVHVMFAFRTDAAAAWCCSRSAVHTAGARRGHARLRRTRAVLQWLHAAQTVMHITGAPRAASA